MKTILDRIQGLGAGGPGASQRGIEDIMRQKSGKAGGTGSSPKSSALGEGAGIGAAGQAIKEQSFAERMQGVQARGKETALKEQQDLQQQQLEQQQQMQQQQLASQAAIARQGIEASESESRAKRASGEGLTIAKLNAASEQTLRDLATTKGIKVDNLFSEYKFSNLELEDRKDKAALEQRAHLLAMQDKDYMEELTRIGIERQLSDKVSWQRELARITLGDQLSNVISDLKFKADANATERQRREELASINIDMALQMASAAIKDENTRAQWEAGGQVVGAVTSDLSSDDSAIQGYFGNNATQTGTAKGATE